MTIDTRIVALPFQVYGKMFARSASSGVAAGQDGNIFKEVGGIAKDINRAPDIMYDMKSVWSDVKNINGKISNPINSLKGSASEVSEWTFFKNTFLDNKVSQNSFLRTLDKTILNTKAGADIVEALGGKIVTEEVADQAGKTVLKKTIEGTAASQVVGNTMAKISGLNLIFASVLEIPDIVKSIENGDAPQQIGRSAVNVTAGWVSTTFFSSLFKKIAPQKFKSIAGLVGGAVGAVLGGIGTSKFNNVVFGKSIASQKKEQEHLEEQQKTKAAAQRLIDTALNNQYNTQTISMMA